MSLTEVGIADRERALIQNISTAHPTSTWLNKPYIWTLSFAVSPEMSSEDIKKYDSLSSCYIVISVTLFFFCLNWWLNESLMICFTLIENGSRQRQKQKSKLRNQETWISVSTVAFRGHVFLKIFLPYPLYGRCEVISKLNVSRVKYKDKNSKIT